MPFNQTQIESNPFIERMELLEDKELLSAIKSGANYQPQGVEAAIMLAIKRGLISQEESEKLLGYTIERIKQGEEYQEVELKKVRATGRVEMILGALMFTSGLIFTILSTHYIWIGALVVGPILFIRGLFK